MNAIHRWRVLLGVSLTLGLAIMACGPSLNLKGGLPTPPASPPPISSTAAAQLENDWGTAAASGSQTVTVTMTEQELTSYAALRFETDPTSPITNTTIYLRTGKILLYGQLNSNGSTIPAVVILSAAPTPSGTVSVTIDTLDVGPIPVPSSLTDSLSQQINDAIAQNAGTDSGNFKVTDIHIDDGQMTVTGVVAQPQQ